MNRCSNCLEENHNVFLVLVNGRNESYYSCPNCSVTYGKDRNGKAYLLEDEVLIKKYHSKTEGRIFVVKGIFIHEECESGRMVYLVDKETGNPLRSILDVNWLESINKN